MNDKWIIRVSVHLRGKLKVILYIIPNLLFLRYYTVSLLLCYGLKQSVLFDLVFWQAIVQMSVQFAQQTELLRLNKGARQKSTSMQTMQSGKDEMEEMENEEPTPSASPSLSFQLEEVERLKRELEERNVVIRMLKEELLKIKSGPEQVCVSYMLCTVIQNPLALSKIPSFNLAEITSFVIHILMDAVLFFCIILFVTVFCSIEIIKVVFICYVWVRNRQPVCIFLVLLRLMNVPKKNNHQYVVPL